MERKTEKLGLINLLVLIAAGAVGYGVARYGNSLSGLVTTIFMGIGALIAVVSWFQMRLEERERLEKLEFEELTRSAASSALFNAQETEVFPAQRSREQFERFFVPAFTVLLFVLQAGGTFQLWRWLSKIIVTPMQTSTGGIAAGIFAIVGLVMFLIGKYTTGIARLDKLRLVRPGASYLLFSAFLSWVAPVGIGLVVIGGFLYADLIVAKVLTVVLGLIAIETLINLILEIYRPRVKGKVERPVYESRVVSLLGQPQGLITTAANTLDYQFGFKVSETWFYRFFEKRLFWIVLAQAAVLLLSTSVVFIDTGEQALLERFGRPVEGRSLLGPGAHLKLPWPIDKTYRYPTDEIQSFNVGFVPDPGRENEKTVLWTVSHTKEENFLVANRDMARADSGTNNTTSKRTPPVSLLTVSIPVQFQITNLVAWAYNNDEPTDLLKHISTREVVRYFVSVDLQEIMSQGRQDAAHTLRERIQAEANKRNLGAHIIYVGLQDIHPPVKVAPDYEKVVAAIHTKEANILAAKADAIITNALADAQSFKLVAEAKNACLRQEVDAIAQAASFTNQIPAYLASPSVYTKRAYLQTFARSVANARKYILLTTNTQDVVTLNLEDKIRQDLLESVTLPPPKK
jgi:membrane protease subunit HflK